MKFVCDRCQTKYSIPDERVRGKVLKVKCKTCANVITVREARSTAAAGVPVMSASGSAPRPRTGANLALSVPDEAPAADSERTQLAHYPPDPNADPFPDLDAFAPPSPVAPKRKTGQMAPLDADDGVQWYMALDGNRTGPFSRGKLVDQLVPLAKSADVHVWNERLGTWKAPKDVPEVAAELTRRRAPAPPVPRRPTPPPIPPLSGFGTGHGVPAGAPRKPTPHLPPSPVNQTGSGVPSKLPPPGGVHPALAARPADHVHGDPSSLLETPAPTPHMLGHAPGHAANGAKTNGVGGSGAHAPPRAVNSDVLQMLNLPGGVETASGAPRLMSLSDVMPAPAPVRAPRKSAIYILGVLGVVAVVVVLVVTNMTKAPKQPPIVAKPAVTTPVEPPVAEKAPEPPPPIAPPPEPPAPPTKGGKKGGKKTLVSSKTSATTQQQTQTGNQGTQGTPTGDAARFSDNRSMNIKPIGPATRPPPSQSDITKVISNNRANIKVCYQRALTRDNTLTHGKLAVKLSIGISGRVKHMSLDGPTQFKLLLEPCIKDVVQRWVFPQASEEYGTEFPLVFQGNE